MKNKSLLMPHNCQKIGWCLLILSVIVMIIKALFVRNIDVAWYFAKTNHVIFIISFFLICLSKEKVEDEMISGFRLKAIGITAYVFFLIFLMLSLTLELRLIRVFSEVSSAYVSEAFLIFLPLCLFVLYYSVFKWMLWKSRKQEAL